MRIGNRTRLDLLFGGGAEALNPFKDEETIVLTTFQGHLGAGIHVDLGRNELRIETTHPRPSEAGGP